MFSYLTIYKKILRFRIKQTSIAAYSSDALKHKEAPIVDNDVILSDKELNERKKLENLVSLPKEVSEKKDTVKKI